MVFHHTKLYNLGNDDYIEVLNGMNSLFNNHIIGIHNLILDKIEKDYDSFLKKISSNSKVVKNVIKNNSLKALNGSIKSNKFYSTINCIKAKDYKFYILNNWKIFIQQLQEILENIDEDYEQENNLKNLYGFEHHPEFTNKRYIIETLISSYLSDLINLIADCTVKTLIGNYNIDLNDNILEDGKNYFLEFGDKYSWPFKDKLLGRLIYFSKEFKHTGSFEENVRRFIKMGVVVKGKNTGFVYDTIKKGIKEASKEKEIITQDIFNEEGLIYKDCLFELESIFKIYYNRNYF